MQAGLAGLNPQNTGDKPGCSLRRGGLSRGDGDGKPGSGAGSLATPIHQDQDLCGSGRFCYQGPDFGCLELSSLKCGHVDCEDPLSCHLHRRSVPGSQTWVPCPPPYALRYRALSLGSCPAPGPAQGHFPSCLAPRGCSEEAPTSSGVSGTQGFDSFPQPPSRLVTP